MYQILLNSRIVNVHRSFIVRKVQWKNRSYILESNDLRACPYVKENEHITLKKHLLVTTMI